MTFPVEEFLSRLRAHLETFTALAEMQRDLGRHLQGSSLDSSGPAALYARLEQEKKDLQPFYEGWKALPAEERRLLLEGEVGAVLTGLEAVAEAIRTRHAQWFEAPAEAAPSPSTLSARIHLHRH